jgi:hypothetical protein
VALQLRRKGITRVHPLQGGLGAWMALHFPVQQLPMSGLNKWNAPAWRTCARRATVRLLLLVGVQPHALQDGRVLQGNRHA